MDGSVRADSAGRAGPGGCVAILWCWSASGQHWQLVAAAGRGLRRATAFWAETHALLEAFVLLHLSFPGSLIEPLVL